MGEAPRCGACRDPWGAGQPPSGTPGSCQQVPLGKRVVLQGCWVIPAGTAGCFHRHRRQSKVHSMNLEWPQLQSHWRVHLEDNCALLNN